MDPWGTPYIVLQKLSLVYDSHDKALHLDDDDMTAGLRLDK